MTEPGIYWGRIDPWEGDVDSVTVDCQLISTASEDSDSPKVALITEFHALMLYKDRLKAVCLLNEQSVFDDHHDGTFGSLIGMAHDQTKNIFWVWSDYAVYKYSVVNESRLVFIDQLEHNNIDQSHCRHVWRIYLDQGQYNLAMRHCSDNPEAMDLILTRY